MRAVQECGDHASFSRAILAALLRALGDPDEEVRGKAIYNLSEAFPEALAELQRLGAILGEDPKPRLAVIHHLSIILAQSLARGFGQQPSPAIKEVVSPWEGPMKQAGRWVAWTRDRKRVLAVADSFPEVMSQATQSGESDPYVKKIQGAHRTAHEGRS
jgi:hypothetical protein